MHACLVDSFLTFERLTVGRLDDAGRQAFHEESMVSAELLRLPRERIPPTVPALRAYLDEVMASGILRMTDGARRVADLFGDPPRTCPSGPCGADLVPGLPDPAAAAAPALRSRGPGPRACCGSLLGLRLGRPLAPPRIRFVAPAVMAGWRLEAATGRWPRRPPTGRPAVAGRRRSPPPQALNVQCGFLRA